MTQLVILCKYSPTPDCKGTCEKCQHLLHAQAVNPLDELATPEQVLNQHAKTTTPKTDKTTTTKINKIQAFLQRCTPEERLTTKDKPKRNPHKKWANLKRKINNITNPLKKHINDIPIRQYTKWAMYYRIAHEKEVRTQ